MEYELYLKNLTGKTFTFLVDPSKKLIELRRKLRETQDYNQVEENDFIFVYLGSPLYDHKTLKEQVRDQTTIMVLVRYMINCKFMELCEYKDQKLEKNLYNQIMVKKK